MTKQDLFINYALRFVGTPYLWGGSNPINGLDCSGLVQLLLSFFGLDPKGDQTANDLYQYSIQYGLKSSPQCGALAFYGNVNRVIHVAMFLDNERIIEAAGGGSNVIDIKTAASHDAFVKVNKYDHRSDLVDIRILKNIW